MPVQDRRLQRTLAPRRGIRLMQVERLHMWPSTPMRKDSDRFYIDGPDRRTVNIAQACAIAGVSRRSIYYWLEAGKVEYVRTAGGKIRIYVDTIIRSDTRYSA